MIPILYTFHIHLPDLSTTSRKTWKLPSVSLALLWSLDAWCLSGCQERRSRRKICRRSWLHEAMVPTDRGGPSISTVSDVETDLQPKRKKDLCFACGLWRAQFWDMTSHIIQQYKEMTWHNYTYDMASVIWWYHMAAEPLGSAGPTCLEWSPSLWNVYFVWFFQCFCVVPEASIFSKSSCVALTFFKNIRFRNQRMCFHHCFCHLSQSKNIGRVADFVDCIPATKFTMCPKYCGHWVPCKMKSCSKLTANTN